MSTYLYILVPSLRKEQYLPTPYHHSGKSLYLVLNQYYHAFSETLHCQLSPIFPPFSTSLSSYLAPSILSINMSRFFSLWGQKKLQSSLDSKSHCSSLSLSLPQPNFWKQSILIVLSSFLIDSSSSTIWFLPHTPLNLFTKVAKTSVLSIPKETFLVRIFLDPLGIRDNIIPSLLLDSLCLSVWNYYSPGSFHTS